MKKIRLLVLILCFPMFLFAQRQYSGKVSDSATSAPLSGAVVNIQGTSKSVVTSDSGTFTIDANPGSKIVVSLVGYSSTTQTLGEETSLSFLLGAQASTLDQVVVVGYGTSSKKDLTAPVSTVNTEEMVKRTTANPMDALQGTVPGVQVVSSGAPGATPTVRIRGVGSTTNQSPLYVVDGMFLDDISFLNTNDIAEMSVLKDASGAAIYGVRAANGVVLITTKKGKRNMKTQITYNGYAGYQVPTHKLKMANGQEYAAMQLAKQTNGDSSRVLLSVQRFGGSGVNPSTNTDWYGELLRNKALIHNHNLDITGGSDKVTYSLGLNYMYQDGVMKADNDYKRYNIHLQTEAKAYDWLKIGFTLHMSNWIQMTPKYDAFARAYFASPLYPVYDPTNTLSNPVDFASSTSLNYNNGVYNNPIATAYYNYNKIKAFQILPSVYAEANIWKNKLTFRSQLSQRYASNLTQNYIPEYYVDNNQRRATSNLTNTQDRYTDYVWDNLLTYKDAKGGHHWSFLLGQSTREQQWRKTWVSADSVPNDPTAWYVGYKAAGGSTVNNNANQGIPSLAGYGEDGTRNAGISYFARATYDYQNKYLLTATIRRDGSSKYQTKWGTFPSVGLGWVLTQEDFMKKQTVFDFLKIRGSWGKMGNDGVTPNAGYAIVNNQQAIFGSTGTTNGTAIPGYTINRFFASMTWETVNEWDGGLEFAAVSNKLNGTIDYYNRTTNNMVLNRPIGFTNGVSILGNWGSVVNSGWEFTLSWNDRVGELGYRIGGNISTLKNKVTNLSGLANLVGGGEFPNRTEVGQPIAYFYGFQMAGVYQTQAEIDADPIAKANGVKPGYLKFKDLNGDNVLDDKDRTNLGSYLPKITYGFNVNLDYKNFDLSILLQGVGGNKILNYNRFFRSKFSDMNGDAKYVTNLWTEQNRTNDYPSAYATTQGWSNQASSFFVESGAYLRVQNIQLGYNFNVRNVKMRVYATADRPLIFTKYNGFTPEVSSSTTTDLANMGYDNNIYPVSATYSFGVKLTF